MNDKRTNEGKNENNEWNESIKRVKEGNEEERKNDENKARMNERKK